MECPATGRCERQALLARSRGFCQHGAIGSSDAGTQSLSIREGEARRCEVARPASAKGRDFTWRTWVPSSRLRMTPPSRSPFARSPFRETAVEGGPRSRSGHSTGRKRLPSRLPSPTVTSAFAPPPCHALAARAEAALLVSNRAPLVQICRNLYQHLADCFLWASLPDLSSR